MRANPGMRFKLVSMLSCLLALSAGAEPCPAGTTATTRELPAKKKGDQAQREQFCADKRGAKEGLYERYWLPGELRKAAEGRYKGGKLEGLWSGWWENGFKKEEGPYQAGLRSGVWKFWHSNGKKAAEGGYKDGKREGRWTAWDTRGKVLHETEYRKGKRISGKEVPEQGDPSERLEQIVPESEAEESKHEREEQEEEARERRGGAEQRREREDHEKREKREREERERESR